MKSFPLKAVISGNENSVSSDYKNESVLRKILGQQYYRHLAIETQIILHVKALHY